eukprot:TRINITY_DN17245_c0_g1_i1.p1 TRINITY_DN17245_c0_g1~~TRINITY_DN17245_c0_g1_i1.p1  ORF type:complete len:136 (+),score=30.08 TRINITY_DN17245_c0_g1_i1:26-409(+)
MCIRDRSIAILFLLLELAYSAPPSICSPPCTNGGLCKFEKCFCISPYSGKTCELELNNDRLSYSALGGLGFVSALLGFLICAFLACCCAICCGKSEKTKNLKELEAEKEKEKLKGWSYVYQSEAQIK